MHATLSIPDMTCDHCKKKIVSALKSLPVDNVEVDLAKHQVAVCYSDTSLDAIKSAIKVAGYSASEVAF